MEESKTEKVVAWDDLDIALEKFEKFLRIAITKGGAFKDRDWHVVFSMGTVIRFPADWLVSDSEKDPIDEKYAEGWPMHRVKDLSIEKIISINTCMWEKQKDQLEEDFRLALQLGYKELIADGYPYPGGEESDRTAVPCEIVGDENSLWMIIWYNRPKHMNITNLSLAKDEAQAVAIAGDLRRYDFMFPSVAAVISPDLEVKRVTH